jgi:hypothetical protein
MTSLRERLGIALQHQRRAHSLSQTQVAKLARLSVKYVGEIERGEGERQCGRTGVTDDRTGVGSLRATTARAGYIAGRRTHTAARGADATCNTSFKPRSRGSRRSTLRWCVERRSLCRRPRYSANRRHQRPAADRVGGANTLAGRCQTMKGNREHPTNRRAAVRTLNRDGRLVDLPLWPISRAVGSAHGC